MLNITVSALSASMAATKSASATTSATMENGPTSITHDNEAVHMF